MMMRLLHEKFQKFRGRGKAGRYGREGFTLVEIMMVLLILSLGILPIQPAGRIDLQVMSSFNRVEGVPERGVGHCGSQNLPASLCLACVTVSLQ